MTNKNGESCNAFAFTCLDVTVSSESLVPILHAAVNSEQLLIVLNVDRLPALLQVCSSCNLRCNQEGGRLSRPSSRTICSIRSLCGCWTLRQLSAAPD